MLAFFGNPRVKADVLGQVISQRVPQQNATIAKFKSTKRTSVCSSASESLLNTFASDYLPGNLLRLAAEIELSYVTLEARTQWNHDFIVGITPGAELDYVWRDYAIFRLSEHALQKAKWLSSEQLQALHGLRELLHGQQDDPASWRYAVQQIAHAILVIDLADRRKHGFGPANLHSSADRLVAQVKELSDAALSVSLTDIGNDTAQLAFSLIEPYWRDNRYFIDIQAQKLLELVKAVPE